MKFLIQLAWKNLSRYRKRTVITATAIAFGLGFFIMIDSMLKGAEYESQINLVNYETGAAKIQQADYLENREISALRHLLEAPSPILAELGRRRIPAAPRIVVPGEAFVYEDPYPTDGSMYFQAVAIDPGADGEVFRIAECVTHGEYLSADSDGILMGSWLAEDLGAKVGYPLTLKFKGRYGAFVTYRTHVQGIVTVPSPVVNRVTVFLPIAVADDLLNMDGAVTEIALASPRFLRIEEQIGEWRSQLSSLPADAVINGWKDIAPDFIAMVTAKSAGTKTILFFVFLIAAVGISNTMLLAVYERMKEFGMMRSLGMSDAQVLFTLIAESAGIGFIGSTLGLAFGSLITWPVVRWGFDYSSMMREGDMGYRILGVFRGIWVPETMIVAFFMGIVMAVVAALIPTRRAVKMQITACLREN